jgi:hypothetical protein
MYNFFCELWRFSVSYPSVGLEPTDGLLWFCELVQNFCELWFLSVGWFKIAVGYGFYPSVGLEPTDGLLWFCELVQNFCELWLLSVSRFRTDRRIVVVL